MTESSAEETKGSANDLSAGSVYLQNNGGFVAKFAVLTPQGLTPWSAPQAIGQGCWVDFAGMVNPGDSCCAAADILGGPSDHNSGNNFNYDPNGGPIQYTITDTIFNPSWNGPFPHQGDETADAAGGAAYPPAETADE